jgi:hypothetical protein
VANRTDNNPPLRLLLNVAAANPPMLAYTHPTTRIRS